MKMARSISFALLALSLSMSFPSEARKMHAEIINPSFRTLKIMAENFMDIPVIRLGTSDHITISFDEIAESNRYLRFRLIHCNADWTPSRLVESEYIDGFNMVDVEDYGYSSNTFIHYVNYHITLPDERIPIIASGNYIMEVVDSDDEDNVILRAPFMVSEGMASISGNASGKTDYGINDRFQQLSLAINPGVSNINPYSDLILSVNQNSRQDTQRYVTQPLRVAGETLIYEHNPQLVFPASNEYRRFETVRADYPGMNVDSVRYGGTNYHHYLKVDEPRVNNSYSFDQTQHGRFLVREFNASDSDLGADYVTVHFELDCQEIQGADVYVDGEFTNGIFDDKNRMRYDYSTGSYSLQMPLKQGAYNYQYVVKPNDSEGKASTSTIEGDKYETSNEYVVALYLRMPASRGDRLLGTAVINSR